MNSFGRVFKITLQGESHSPAVGVIISGVPLGIVLGSSSFRDDLLRRKSGAKGTTQRQEDDIAHITNGTLNGITTGEPLRILFKNSDIHPEDYEQFRSIPRPGHADFVAQIKYREHHKSGGGIFSGRMTLPLVAAGVVAKNIIAPISISARLIEAGGVPLEGNNPFDNKTFCDTLDRAVSEGDSLGGVVECVCTGVPIGLGDPFFDSLESRIAHLAFSVPGIRGIEFGDGFAASRMKGSQHNDCFIDSKGSTATNGAGGINGGISNGNPIVFRVAVKPPSSISKTQRSYNFAEDQMEDFTITGRHDVCFALRLPVVMESVAACVLCDELLSMDIDS